MLATNNIERSETTRTKAIREAHPDHDMPSGRARLFASSIRACPSLEDSDSLSALHQAEQRADFTSGLAQHASKAAAIRLLQHPQ